MESKQKSKKKSLIILGSLLILSSLSIFIYKSFNTYEEVKEEDNALEEFYEVQEEIVENNEEIVEEKETKKETKYDYIAVINIPKINLERGLVDPSSKYNNVNYNIQILDESDMPNIINGDFILAAHSGSARISYFRNINKLDIDDEVYITYKGTTYTYKVTKKYEIEKTGKAVIKTSNNETNLVLITCIHNTNKQLVIILKR